MSTDQSSPLSGITRRQFLYYSALAAGATALAGCTTPRPRRISANEKLNIGVVGTGGKGASDTDCCAGENIVALCDVDEKAPPSRRTKYPNAKFYKDFRKMLEQEKSLDAVDRVHARSHARDRCRHGHAHGQTRLLPEAADADDL